MEKGSQQLRADLCSRRGLTRNRECAMQGWRSWRTTVTGAVLGALLFGTGLHGQVPAAPPTGQGTPGPAAAKEETCRVSGLVEKMADGSPLKNATVLLSTESDREHTIATKT